MADEENHQLSVDAGGQGLLAALNGAMPEAPAWFAEAVAHPKEQARLTVAGAEVHALAWGERGKPALLLLHGNGAHAHWWDFIAPYFANGRRVIAPTWSGMGDSAWRPAYGVDFCVAEAMAVAEALGAFESAEKPLIVAHSFGGYPALALAADHGDRFKGVVSVDSPVEPPDEDLGGPPQRHKPNRIYPTFEAILARFRLAPPQPCENLFAVDHIARHSIKKTESGYTWKFDPFIWKDFQDRDAADLMRAARCPVAVVWGERSILMSPKTLAHMRNILPAGSPFVPIPAAAHHVMLDQPLAFVTALRGLMSVWPPEVG
jgi:pimeloyl-ACP methyl ester carboxylesterase